MRPKGALGFEPSIEGTPRFQLTLRPHQNAAGRVPPSRWQVASRPEVQQTSSPLGQQPCLACPSQALSLRHPFAFKPHVRDRTSAELTNFQSLFLYFFPRLFVFLL